eukprot:13317166-Alexandrium_andersonii.AAC.1
MLPYFPGALGPPILRGSPLDPPMSWKWHSCPSRDLGLTTQTPDLGISNGMGLVGIATAPRE